MTGKRWNDAKNNWEIDGEPVTYRVTWRSADDGGERHSRELTNIDQGYDSFQRKQKSADAYDVTWEHLPY